MAIKTDKIINELSKYDTVEELFHTFEEIEFFVIGKVQEEQKKLQSKADEFQSIIDKIKQ
jgi:hypothetical protein